MFSENEKRKISATLKSKYKNYEFILISTKTKKGIDELKEKLFQSFGKIRIYTKQPNKKQKTNIVADIVNENSYKDILNKRQVYFFGDGAYKCQKLISHTNARFLQNIYPNAINMVSIAFDLYEKQKFEDTAYFEPFYLKDFIATVPKKNIYK